MTEPKPDPRALAAVLRHIRRYMDAGEANEKHSILVHDPQTGTCHIIGPFDNRLTAKLNVPFLQARNLKADPKFANLTYEVVLTFSPEES